MFSHKLLITLLSFCFFSNEIFGNGPEVQIITNSVSCNGSSDGQIIIKIPDVTQEYTTRIFKYSPEGDYLTPKIYSDTTSFNIENLVSGKYFVEIKGDKGFSFTESIELTEPDKLETGKIKINKKLSSPEATDAILQASPEGGVPPYTYNWSSDNGKLKESELLENVGQGVYTCIINDVNNCGPVKVTILFNTHVMPDIIEE
ncbi:MAG: hypothetical protein JW894_12400 [Bacteroidales bacterium]|nr:hypothetical protein [Bacteroidales bacterium]